MARALKTYMTAAGFFELAIAAPSMKAALEAWGADSNLFAHGYATETDDPAIVAATMAKPGVVLKRAIGSKGAFREQAELPRSLPAEIPKPAPRKVGKPAAKIVNLADERAARRAAAEYAKERERQERERRKEEAALAKERERRGQAVAKAEAALEQARQKHDDAMADIRAQHAALDRKAEAEDARWDAEKAKLKDAIARARE